MFQNDKLRDGRSFRHHHIFIGLL